LGTALLVDDEEMVRLSTADMLMDLGYDVVEARSGEEALRLIDGGLIPDLVVTDHLMPGMTGVELARTLRINRPKLPLLIISGYAEEVGIDPSLTRLTKPFRNAELTASLAALPAFPWSTRPNRQARSITPRSHNLYLLACMSGRQENTLMAYSVCSGHHDPKERK
jgi:CheY-like chemotaxis protein